MRVTKLSDIKLIILTAACHRPNRVILPLPERLKGGAAHKVAGALLAKGLEEIAASHGDPVWRETRDGQGITLVATTAALEGFGLKARAGPQRPLQARQRRVSPPGPAEAPQPPASHPAALRGKVRAGTKQAQLVAMLERD